MTQFFNEKEVLVTGGTGTIGTSLCNKLHNMGAKVTAVSLHSEQKARRILSPNVNFLNRDLTSYDNCIEVASGKDFVFHLTAIKGSSQLGNSRVASAYRSFILCDSHMMEASYRSGVERFLYVSSICAYPDVPLRKEAEIWSGPPAANDRFTGIAKRAAESLAEAYSLQYGWDAVRIVRPSNVYGPFDDFNPISAQVIPALIAKAISSQDDVLQVAGDGSAVRDFIFSEDCVDGILRAVELAPACTPINLGAGRGCKIIEVCETIAEVLLELNIKRSLSLSLNANAAVGDRARVLDCELASRLIDFSPTTSLKEGILRTVKWYVENREIC